MNPLHKHKIMSVGYQVKQNLKSGDMENLNSLLKFLVWQSGRKIDPATGTGLNLLHGTKFQRFLSGKSVFLNSKFQIREFHAH